jgi:hypothetical protein
MVFRGSGRLELVLFFLLGRLFLLARFLGGLFFDNWFDSTAHGHASYIM